MRNATARKVHGKVDTQQMDTWSSLTVLHYLYIGANTFRPPNLFSMTIITGLELSLPRTTKVAKPSLNRSTECDCRSVESGAFRRSGAVRWLNGKETVEI